MISMSSIYVAVLAYAAYVVRQPYDAYPTGVARAARISPTLLVPIIATVIYRSIDSLFGAMIRHTEKRINKVNDRSEKIVQGLKDDMKFDRTEKLLRKYDREWMSGHGGPGTVNGAMCGSDVGSDRSEEIPAGFAQAATTTPVSAGIKPLSQEKPPMSLSKKLMMSTVGGASLKLSGALAQLWTLTADTVIGDDPVLLRSLKNAEVHAQSLTEENSRLRAKLERYENEYGVIYDVDEANDSGSDGDDSGHVSEESDVPVADVRLRAEDLPASEENDNEDEGVVEMVVTEDGVDSDGNSDGNADGLKEGEEEQEATQEDVDGDEEEDAVEPEPVPAPRRSRRTRRG